MDALDREIPGDADALEYANPPVSCDPPNLKESKWAMKQLNREEAPSRGGIYAEILKARAAVDILHLHSFE